MARRTKGSGGKAAASKLEVLQTQDIIAIDEALRDVGPDGQVHLVVEEGRLSYIRMLQSELVGETHNLGRAGR